LRASFEQAHQQMYGYTAPEEPIQVVTFRIEAIGSVKAAEFNANPPAKIPLAEAQMAQREVWLPEANGFVALAVYDREKLGAGHRIVGPAIVEQMDATTVVLPGQTATVDPYLNLIVEG
jgi:N-methylhydantoinase A